MKTLLQINSVVNTGSTGRIAEEIGQIAISHGWNSFIAYGRNDCPSQSKLVKIGNVLDVKLHGVLTRIFDRHGLGSHRATVQLIKQIKKINPDIIHLHNLHGYYINIKVLFIFLHKFNKPVVWTLHDCWSFTGHCVYFDNIGCYKWETQCLKCPHKRNYPASFVLDQSKENYLLKKQLFCSLNNLTLVTVSNWLEKLLSKSFLKNNKTTTIHNGINTNIFKPLNDNKTHNNKLKGKFVILGVASIWDYRKGFSDFIRLGKLLNDNYKIILIGLNKTQLKEIPESIIGVERTESAQELANLYAKADVFVNPTYEDNFPTTNIEALACGTPVITYRTGGSPEAIDDNTGIIVDKGNIDDLIVSIEKIKANGKAFYSKHCRERAIKYFKKEERYLEYLKLYDTLLK